MSSQNPHFRSRTKIVATLGPASANRLPEMIRAGVDVAKVSKWLGHSSIRTTVDIYTHLGGYDDDINRG